MVHVIPRKEGDGIFELEQHVIDEKIRVEVKKKMQKHFDQLVGVSQDYSEQEKLQLDPELPVEKEKLPDTVKMGKEKIKVLKGEKAELRSKAAAKELEEFDGEHVEILEEKTVKKKRGKTTKEKKTVKKTTKTKVKAKSKKSAKAKVVAKVKKEVKAAAKKKIKKIINKAEVDIADLL